MSTACKEAQAVTVGLGGRAYEIRIGAGLLAEAADCMLAHLDFLDTTPRPRAAIITDRNVARLYLDELESSLNAAGIAHEARILPPGEATKSFAHYHQLSEWLLERRFERGDFIIAFGGGVIGDLAGFAAATLRRGMRFVQIPTTLLAQVDSSVGGKTGINSTHGKNLIGAFHQPSLVIADTSVLDTLPRRELLAGYAEVVKYGLLGDAAFFAWLEDNGARVLGGDGQALARAIRTCCEMKSAIVARDERESGVRALLNLGHTFGHALEAALGYDGTLLHGEAVAIGMVQALRFSAREGLCPAECASRAEAHLSALGLPVDLRAIRDRLPGAAALAAIMAQDKKAKGGKLVFILARGIGEAFIAEDVPARRVEDFLRGELERDG